MTDDVVTNNRSEDDDPREGDHRATGAVDALNWLTTTVYVGVGLDGDCSSSLAQEAKDRRAEHRVTPREFR